MPYYRKILCAALVAVLLGYGVFVALMLTGGRMTGASPLTLTVYILAYLLWIAVVVAIQAAQAGGQQPDEREAGIDLRSERLSARVLEGGVFALLALVLWAGFRGPGGLGRFTPDHPGALVLYLITIVTAAAVARLCFAIWQELRA